MRKPDGTTAEDAVRGRLSLSGSLSPEPLPRPQPALRRKSVLPSRSSRNLSAIEDDEEKDEDEVDDLPDLSADGEGTILISPADEAVLQDRFAVRGHGRKTINTYTWTD